MVHGFRSEVIKRNARRLLWAFVEQWSKPGVLRVSRGWLYRYSYGSAVSYVDNGRSGAMRCGRNKARGVAASRLADWRRVDDSRSALDGVRCCGGIGGAAGVATASGGGGAARKLGSSATGGCQSLGLVPGVAVPRSPLSAPQSSVDVTLCDVGVVTDAH